MIIESVCNFVLFLLCVTAVRSLAFHLLCGVRSVKYSIALQQYDKRKMGAAREGLTLQYASIVQSGAAREWSAEGGTRHNACQSRIASHFHFIAVEMKIEKWRFIFQFSIFRCRNEK
jgi:hypothetical protein